MDIVELSQHLAVERAGREVAEAHLTRIRPGLHRLHALLPQARGSVTDAAANEIERAKVDRGLRRELVALARSQGWDGLEPLIEWVRRNLKPATIETPTITAVPVQPRPLSDLCGAFGVDTAACTVGGRHE